MEEDWDLHAVVRGCCNSTTITTKTTNNNTSTSMENPFSFTSLGKQDQFLSLPDLYESSSNVLEKLERLYKPFSPNSQQPISSPKSISSIRVSPVLGRLQIQQQQQQKQIKQVQSHLHLTGSVISTTSTTQSQTPRPKRRKNQQKRVVCQIPARGLSSDRWAWRKYGQKPIKGSPYPRGYYRCSSSKGCLARKQVERSRSDPSMFIVTYTAEHNHPVPTHRNSLAGSTRHKFSISSKGTTTTINGGDEEITTTTNNKPSCSYSSPNSTTDLSPITPLMVSMDKQEIREDEEMIDEDEEDEILIPPDMAMADDFFRGLEELSAASGAPNADEKNSTVPSDPVFDDCFTDHFPTSFPSPLFTNNATSAAGGS